MSSRELLFLQPSAHSDVLVPRLCAAGWKVSVAHDADEARDVLAERHIHVGLAHIDESLSSRHELLDLWPGTERMEWVAMLDSERLRSGRLARVISDHFYDYHTLPADVNRLLFSLGHAYGMATMSRADGAEVATANAHRHVRGLTLYQARDEAERVVLLSTLRRTGNNISSAARELGVSRVTLYRLLRKHRVGG
jgi:DNA-binding NtrC family response regulator